MWPRILSRGTRFTRCYPSMNIAMWATDGGDKTGVEWQRLAEQTLVSNSKDAAASYYRVYLRDMQWYLNNGWTVYYMDGICLRVKYNTEYHNMQREHLAIVGSTHGLLPNSRCFQGPPNHQFTARQCHEFFATDVLPQIRCSKSVVVLPSSDHQKNMARPPPKAESTVTPMMSWLRSQGIIYNHFTDNHDLHRRFILPGCHKPEYRRYDVGKLACEAGVGVLILPAGHHYLNPFTSELRERLRRRVYDGTADYSKSNMDEKLEQLPTGDWAKPFRIVEQRVASLCDRFGIAAGVEQPLWARRAMQRMKSVWQIIEVEGTTKAQCDVKKVASDDHGTHESNLSILSQDSRNIPVVPATQQPGACQSAQPRQSSSNAATTNTTKANDSLRCLRDLLELSERKDDLLRETHRLLDEQRRRDVKRLSQLANLVTELRRKDVVPQNRSVS